MFNHNSESHGETHMKPLTPLLVPFGIGVVSGVLAALCGVGGGIIMVPAFVALLGVNQKVATATSMAVIVPTAIATTCQSTKPFATCRIVAAIAVGTMTAIDVAVATF